MGSALPPTPNGPPGLSPPAALGRRARSRRRRRQLAALTLVLLVAATVAWVATGRSQGPASMRNQELDTGPNRGPAPGFSLPSLADPATSLALDDYRGRPVVVNFWASWCVPCRREMPRLDAAARRLDGRVAFLGVNYQDTRDDALEFIEETGASYPSGVDDDGAVGRRYGLYGLPTTIFVSPDGLIDGRYLGEMSEDTLDRFLDQLVGAR